MDLLISTKGDDIRTWRGAQDFAASFRHTLLDQTASDHFGDAETVFSGGRAALESAIATHRELLERLNNHRTSVAAATPSTDLKTLTASFYHDLYLHFGQFRSATIFYQLSMTFLCQISETVIALARDQLGLFSRHLPKISLAAVGPAGRGEYSPFCPLHLLLVHDEATSSQLQTIDLFCHTIHDGFEAAGFPVDATVTPRNSRWRGSAAEWQQRCIEGLQPKADENRINLFRLIDQYPLATTGDFEAGLKELCSTTINSGHPAQAQLVERMSSLSNGITLMGRLKLERDGGSRTLFRLLDYGLLPLSAALSACALIRKSNAAGTCDRIRDLLKRRDLDVDVAERMLTTWHTLHGLYLQEQALDYREHPDRAPLLNMDNLTGEQRHSLKEALESVAIIQRHVAIMFSGTGA